MIKFLIFISFIAYCNASGGYGGSGLSMGSASGGGYGGGQQMLGFSDGNGGGGYGGGGNGGNGYSQHNGGPITAAVQSRHSVEIRPVPTQYTQIQPQIIEVDSGDMPIILKFNSRSSSLMVQQSHTPAGPGEVQSTQSEDEPHRLVHEVVKPVIQEVREIITPYRRVIQEVRPVVEEVHTVVAKGEGRRRDSYDSMGGGGYGNGGGMGSGGYGNGGGMGSGMGSGMGLTLGAIGYGSSSNGGALSLGDGDSGYGSARSNIMNLGGSAYGNGLSLGGSSSTKSYKS